mgnify:CR=1 FL=1
MGKSYIGGFPLAFPFFRKSAKPILDDMIVDTINDLKTLEKLYKWQEVTCNDTGIKYKWNGQDQTNLENWIPVGGNVDLSGYQEKETGKGLSSNDYSNADKSKNTETLIPYVSKEYKTANATVIFDNKIYELQENAPFNSTNFATELTAKKWKEISVSFPKPTIKSVTPLYVSINTSVVLSILGSYFTKESTVTIGGLVTSFNIIDDRTITVNLTTDAILQGHNIVVTNESGATTFESQFFVANETVIVPNASSWDLLGNNSSDLVFSDGVVAPNSLNSGQDRRTKSKVSLIPSNRDFELKYTYKTQIGGSNYTGAYIGLINNIADFGYHNNCFFSSQLTDGTHNLYESGVLQGTANANDTQTVLIKRVDGVITCYHGSGTLAITLPTANNDSFYLVTQIVHHLGIKDIEITLKV